MPVKVVNYRSRVPEGSIVVNTTSHAAEAWQRELSPFNVGPVELTLSIAFPQMPRFSRNMENAWQYSKVYSRHVGADGMPTSEYFTWAAAGFNNPQACRFPMGKGAKPVYSLYVDPITREVQRLNYIQAREKIYVPLYARSVVMTQGYNQLKALVTASEPNTVYLRDFDGYNSGTKTFFEILNDPNKKMGHAFVLVRLIEVGRI